MNNRANNKGGSTAKVSEHLATIGNANTNAELEARIRHQFAEQDKGLDQLHEIVGRLKKVAEEIGETVEKEKPLLEALESEVDRSTGSIQRATKTAEKIADETSQSSSCLIL